MKITELGGGGVLVRYGDEMILCKKVPVFSVWWN